MAAPQELFYKFTRPDGTDLWSGTVDYARALETGEVIRHPWSVIIDPVDDSTYLSLSATPGDTLGNGFLFVLEDGTVFGRLFQVEAVGEAIHLHQWHREGFSWRGVSALQVVSERPATEALGPNSTAFIEFVQFVLKQPETAFWELAKNHVPLPDGVGIKIRDVTLCSGVFAAAAAARTFLVRQVAPRKVPPNRPLHTKEGFALSLVATGWSIITRGLIPAEYTDLMMRTWRKTFGADYA
jgi:hypothetical protein